MLSFSGLIALHLAAFIGVLSGPIEAFKAGKSIPILFYIPTLHKIFGDELFPAAYIVTSVFLFAGIVFLNYKCIEMLIKTKKKEPNQKVDNISKGSNTSL
jgi:hypothetical protein